MATERVPVGMQLKPGKDEDLIQWWNSLTGDRSAALKAALRAGLGLQVEHGTPAQPDELAILRQRVAVLEQQNANYQEWFVYIDAQLRNRPVEEIASLPEEVQPVSEEAAKKMAKRAGKWKQQW